MENQKQYGKYPGAFVSPSTVRYCSESVLYAIITGIGKEIERLEKHASEEGLAELEYALEYAIYQTTRFGVQIPVPKDGEHVEKTESYLKWFAKWDAIPKK